MKNKYSLIDKIYFSEMSEIPLLTKEEEHFLIKELARPNGKYEGYRNKLVEGNLRLVIDIAKKFYVRGLEFMDLVQEGNMGLIRAVKSFDYQRGVRFSTYATYWIRAYIGKATKRKSRTIRIPDNSFDKMLKLNYFKEQIQQEMERKPTREELADRVGIPIMYVNAILNLLKPLVNIYESYDDEVCEFIDKKAKTPEEITTKAQLKVKIRDICEFLEEREKKVLFLRYGIKTKDEKGLKLKEVGDILHLSKEGVRQIQAKATRKMQTPERKKALESLL